MKSIVALTLTLALIGGARAVDIAHDGVASIYAVQGEDETLVAKMKHAHSPFASKEQCETEGASDMPALATAISQKYDIIEGRDFKITYACEPAGQGI